VPEGTCMRLAFANRAEARKKALGRVPKRDGRIKSIIFMQT